MKGVRLLDAALFELHAEFVEGFEGFDDVFPGDAVFGRDDHDEVGAFGGEVVFDSGFERVHGDVGFVVEEDAGVVVEGAEGDAERGRGVGVWGGVGVLAHGGERGFDEPLRAEDRGGGHEEDEDDHDDVDHWRHVGAGVRFGEGAGGAVAEAGV